MIHCALDGMLTPPPTVASCSGSIASRDFMAGLLVGCEQAMCSGDAMRTENSHRHGRLRGLRRLRGFVDPRTHAPRGKAPAARLPHPSLHRCLLPWRWLVLRRFGRCMTQLDIISSGDREFFVMSLDHL